MGCTSGIMKCVLNILNSFMAIGGILLIILATVTLKTAPPNYVMYMYIVGGVNLCAALLGCCGICHEHVCMTATYALICLATLIAQICSKVYSFDYEAPIKKFAREDVEKTWEKELKTPGAMDNTQQTYGCCGKIGPTDYTVNLRSIPKSCYLNEVVEMKNIYTTGCIKAAEQKYVEIFGYASSGEWFVLAVSAVMFIFAVYLVIRFRSKQRHYNY
ncbi:tetraspanin 42Ek isoform 1-T2 [Cochliomyia hominivorax]